jgi:hypothetical protein
MSSNQSLDRFIGGEHSVQCLHRTIIIHLIKKLDLEFIGKIEYLRVQIRRKHTIIYLLL